MSVLFPKWTNILPTAAAIGTLGIGTAAVAGYLYYVTPDFWRVGYMPTQPGAGFSHQIHVAKLGMDCRYCHTHVEKSPVANVPTVSTCIGCHGENKLQGWDVHKVQFVREAYAKDAPIPWRKVHKLPDYAHFPHHIHVRAGVSCYSCHGQIAGMPVVFHAEPMSMGWCLDCHREPEPKLVPRDQVTNVIWVEEHMRRPVAERAADGKKILEALKLAPPENCGACHY